VSQDAYPCYQLLFETIDALQSESDTALLASRLKDTMKRKRPQFSERSYGYRSFSTLLREAAKLGFITIHQDERSGTVMVDGFSEERGKDTMSDESSNMPSVEYLVDALAGPRRRSRQDAAHYLALKAHEDASQLTPFVDDLIDALYRPEAQTRWEVFDALGAVALINADSVAEGFDGAEASLFD
jgi:hypothetical protein